MYKIQGVDIDPERLTTFTNRHEEGAGKTTTTLMLMLGEVQLGDSLNKYMYLCDGDSYYARHICHQFVELLNDEGYQCELNLKDTTVLVMNTQQKFWFRPLNNHVQQEYLGRAIARTFIDVDVITETEYLEVVKFIKTESEIVYP